MQVLTDDAKNHLLSLVNQPHGPVENVDIATAELRAHGLLNNAGITPDGRVKVGDLVAEARRGRG